MRKIYFIARLTAYICSIGGVGLLLYSQRASAEYAQTINMAGFVLLVVGFLSFLVSYSIFLYSKLRK